MYVNVSYFPKQTTNWILCDVICIDPHVGVECKRSLNSMECAAVVSVLFYLCLGLPRLQTACALNYVLVVCVCVFVCSAERHGLLLGLFQE